MHQPLRILHKGVTMPLASALRRTVTAVPRPLTVGLRLLRQARETADNLGESPWDFALEMAALEGAGLSPTDLRWLVCKGYVEHADETTRGRSRHRTFRRTGRLTFSGKTCFVLTAAGMRTADPIHGLTVVASRDDGQDDPAPALPVIPVWDPLRRELSVDGMLVKVFRQPSRNQERLLTAFQEAGWPAGINDPLPDDPRRIAERRLHDTVNSLNRHQVQPLIRFHCQGNGTRVTWELVGSEGHHQSTT